MLAKNMLSKLVFPLKPSDSGHLALNWMEDTGVTHLPLVDKENLLGLVKNTDLYSLENLDEPLAKQKIPFIRPYVYADQHFFDVLQITSDEKLSLIPVLDQNNHYIGSITHVEIIQTMADFTSVRQPGGVLVLEINAQQYSLSELSRLIESNDAKVLSACITSTSESSLLEVTIKVSTMDLSSIIQTLNRFDYIIKASFANESTYDSLLSERYEALMKYLDT